MCAPTSGQFGEGLLRSLEYLQFKVHSHNAIEAYEYVGSVLSEQQKYALYRDMFHKEWSQSRASLYRRGYYERYSERANELFRLINDKCFPLLELAHDDPEGDLESFAIPPYNVDLCCEEIDFDHTKPGYVLGLLFYSRDEAWTFLDDKYGFAESDFAVISNEPHASVWNRRESLYGDLIRLVDHSTGNPWLDTTYCQSADWYSWNRNTIEELAAEHKNAMELFKRLEMLDLLIEKHPKEILTDLIDFWNTGQPRNPTVKGDESNEQE